jgi:hypothetical protein
MPNNPFVKAPPPDQRLRPPRSALVPGGGVPANECLNNWMPAQLCEGALCYVLDQAALYRFEKFSTTAPAGVTVIATMAGTGVPGRWKLLTAAAASKSYCALCYAYPNTDGATAPITANPIAANQWTLLNGPTHAIQLAANGLLTFDADKSVNVVDGMLIQVDWYLSWYTSGGTYKWSGCVLRNSTTPVPGSICTDYYVPENTGQLYSVMSGSSIITAAKGDTLQLAVRCETGPIGEGFFVANHGNLVVTEL